MRTETRLRAVVVGAGLAACLCIVPAMLNAQDRKAAPPATTQAKGADQDEKAKEGDPKPRRTPSATDILRELTKRENAPRTVVVRPSDPGRSRRTTVAAEAVPSGAIRIPERRLLPDGTRLVDRPGRLAREGDYFVLAFESRGRGTPELPIRLLPNRMLEDMEIKSRGGTQPIVFIVSGEITEYHGVNYLLVQKLLLRPELGNLK